MDRRGIQARCLLVEGGSEEHLLFSKNIALSCTVNCLLHSRSICRINTIVDKKLLAEEADL